MAGSLNQVQLIGNLGKDPEVRATQSGDKIANFSLATSEVWNDKNSGERKEKTEWHRVAVFGKLAEVVEKYAKKGSKLYVCGKLQTRKWTDQQGQEKYTTEIVLSGFDSKLLLLDRAEGGGGGNGGGGGQRSSGGGGWDSQPRGGNRGGGGSTGGGFGGGSDLDDEIPF